MTKDIVHEYKTWKELKQAQIDAMRIFNAFLDEERKNLLHNPLYRQHVDRMKICGIEIIEFDFHVHFGEQRPPELVH